MYSHALFTSQNSLDSYNDIPHSVMLAANVVILKRHYCTVDKYNIVLKRHYCTVDKYNIILKRHYCTINNYKNNLAAL